MHSHIFPLIPIRSQPFRRARSEMPRAALAIRPSTPCRAVSSAACCFVALAVPLLPSLRYPFALVSNRAGYRTRALRDLRSKFSTATMSSGSASGTVGGGAGIVVPAPSGKAESVVIFSHGLGDTAGGWAPAFPLPGLPNTKYVLPTADVVPVTLNGGMRMNSWFDLFGLDESAPDDTPGITRAAQRILRIVDDEIAAGIPSSKIVVAGFSQGGAVALSAAFQSSKKLAGFLAMSSWVPKSIAEGNMSAHLSETPVLMCHGDADMVVPVKWGKKSASVLTEMKVPVTLKTYPAMGHSANDQELRDVREFLKTCFA